MKYKELGYYNGKISPLRETRVPMLDRACYFGDGIYEACMSFNGRMLGLDDHLDRCYNSMKLVKITPPMEKAEMKSLILELASMMEADSNLVYWQISRGVGLRDHVFAGAETGASFWVMITQRDASPINRVYKAITVPDKRFYYCNIKTLNLLPNVLYNQMAAEAGVDETILHRDGRVTECAHSNVSILKNGTFQTAPLDDKILPGITRKHLLAICKAQGIPALEQAYSLDDLFAADEIIITSSGTLCASVSEIDGKPVGGKDPVLLERLRAAYAQKVKDDCGWEVTRI